MGTVFTFDVRDPGDWDQVLAQAVAWLHHVDATFSTYRPDSVVCRLDRGEKVLAAREPQVAEVFALCAAAEANSGGFFTVRPNGHLDPSAVVKGWAVEHASRMLLDAGARNHAVSGGGDMQLCGTAGPGRPWRVGVADPAEPGKLLCVVVGSYLAVATSGTAERGPHIVDPHTGRPATDLVSLTVVGSSLTQVDTAATAAFAMGAAGLPWLVDCEGLEGFAVTADGTRCATAGMAAYLSR